MATRPVDTSISSLSSVPARDHAIFDAFLDQQEMSDLWAFLRRDTLTKIHQTGLVRAYSFADGECFTGSSFKFTPSQATNAAPKFERYQSGPSDGEPLEGRPIRALAEAIFRHDDVRRFMATTSEWSALSLCPYIYPVGTGLGWHPDPDAAAAFIYYAHPSWEASWGGELLVQARPENSGEDVRERATDLPLAGGQPILADVDFGHYILPRPNRLVLIRGGVWHAIRKVEAAAGSSARVSISGFFLPPVSAHTP